jgi:hypothetical protein
MQLYLARDTLKKAENATVGMAKLLIFHDLKSAPPNFSVFPYSGYNDVFRIYTTTQRDGVDFNLAYIGSDFKAEHEVPFDQTYMRALFDYSYQRARVGYPWSKIPPIFGAPAQR